MPPVCQHLGRCNCVCRTAVTARCPSLSASTPVYVSAVKAGFPGAAAAAAQSASFMWISTVAAFQYRSGSCMSEAFRTLYAQGGISRFYSGLFPTVMHVTLCRFGDTTANVMAMNHVPSESIPLKTAIASVIAAGWRAILLPLETVRSNLQVKGPISGRLALHQRLSTVGLAGMYSGATASFSAGLLGHFPFFCTVNVLSNAVPLSGDASTAQKISRNGGMGFLASMCSDVVTNGFKIVATNKQTSRKPMSYYETAQKIISRDGLFALVTRGLKTRMIGNGLQGATFVLLWKEIESRRSDHTIVS